MLDFDIYRQGDINCGESCLTAISDYFRGDVCATRDAFLGKLDPLVTYLGGSNSKTIENLKRGAESKSIEAEIHSLQKLPPQLNPNQALIIMLAWKNWQSNKYYPRRYWYEERHYVWIYRIDGESVFVWEPSFGDRAELPESTFKVAYSPLWLSSWKDIIERNSGLIGHSSSTTHTRGSYLLLTASNGVPRNHSLDELIAYC